MADYIRSITDIQNQRIDIEGFPTQTSHEQKKVEISVEAIFEKFIQQLVLDPDTRLLLRQEHETFLYNSINILPEGYQCLDSSRPWLCFWILNAANLLNYKFTEEINEGIVSFLEKCRSPKGGFCGGPGQSPHLAPTYAAVNALVIIGTERAYEVIDRKSLRNFLYLTRHASGGFCMHEGGELDVRGAYCAISVAKLTRMVDDQLFVDTAKWISSCQTYEGGFGGSPNMEAHGGYTFCASAALTLLGDSANCNLQKLLRWTVNRQMKLEGGFQGRTNKLVDGCYSFWQGASVPIIQALIVNEKQKRNLLRKNTESESSETNSKATEITENDESEESSKSSSVEEKSKLVPEESVSDKHSSNSRDNGSDKTVIKLSNEVLFNRAALQEYVLFACQLPKGGLIDKPGKPRDLYHTCYTLSGLSIAQHGGRGPAFCLGGFSTELKATHILHNVPPEAVDRVYGYFDGLNSILEEPDTGDRTSDNDGDEDKNYEDFDVSEGYA